MKNYVLLVFVLLMNTACTERVKVMVGGEKNYDACYSAAEVFSSTAKKVTVYSAPDDESNVIDEVATGIYVSVCDYSDKTLVDDWVGIVYKNDESLVCGVGTTVEKRQPYSGPCKSGWIKRANLKNWIG
ncbi:hypothetical protein [Marinomonas epiphytica]